MLSQNLLCATIFLFVMGVKKVEPLKCFSCSYSVRGREEQGPRACKDLKSSDTNSKIFVQCDNSTKSCSVKKGQAYGRYRTPTCVWERKCSEEDRTGCRDAYIGTGKRGSGTVCYCKTDGCNAPNEGEIEELHPGSGSGSGSGPGSGKNNSCSSGVTFSLMLMTLCLSWAVLRNFRYLF